MGLIPRLISVVDIERDQYRDPSQSWTLNGTDTKNSIEFSNPTILIPIPGLGKYKRVKIFQTVHTKLVL